MSDTMTTDFDELLRLGLSEQKVKETLKNEAVTKRLKDIIKQVSVLCKDGGFDKNVGILLYHVATKYKQKGYPHLALLCSYVANRKIHSELRLNAALEYLSCNPGEEVDIGSFEAACGVGVTITPEQIEAAVENILCKHKQKLTKERYKFPIGALLAEARKELKWADGKAVKNEVDMQVLHLLGPKTDTDLQTKNKAKESKKKPELVEESGAANITELMKTKLHLHKPGENFKSDGYVITPNTFKLLKQHTEITGNKVQTRFPPEPNGILHIGHAKAININFGYAAAHGGVCYLRYDDTNPEKEEERFFIGILDMVEWLGYKPWKITHSSDYFDILYSWAKDLITCNLAYVCHQQSDEIKGFNPPPSPWRDRPIAESLQLFEDMKNGKLDEGSATLRLKVTLEEGKQDPVAYRIKYVAHHRTGNKWCIYPTYDYTHCLCDSIENISHSLCTKEFQSRRSSYYWLCNALNIYCPVQWEYGRLNVSYTVVSKRKIAKLIERGIVKDWDDPRLFTLTALRRRGFPPQAINNFCAQMGVTGAQMTMDPVTLDAAVRDELNLTAKRTMVVLEPLKINVLNFEKERSLSVPDFPTQPEGSHHQVALSSILYIEKSDFREKTDDKGYRRLTVEQSVGLKHAGLVITVIRVHKDSTGEVTSIDVNSSEATESNKPKAFIHWVSKPEKIKVRIYDRLFKHSNPEEQEGGFLNDCNTNTLTVYSAMADKSLLNAQVYEKFQFERLGYFSVDPDSSSSVLLFNRTVSLKEDSGKN